MTLTRDEQGLQVTHHLLQQMVQERAALEVPELNKIVEEIQDSLISFEVHDTSAPLFEKLVNVHLEKYGVIVSSHDEEQMDDESDEDLGQRTLFIDDEKPARVAEMKIEQPKIEEPIIELVAQPEQTTEAPREAEEEVNRLFEPVPEEAQKVDLSENALRVLTARYLRKNDEGETVETPYEMFQRVAENIAKAEQVFKSKTGARKVAREFLEMMTEMRFLPNSPTLMNAGRELQQLSACFVLPVEDSMDSIFSSIRNTALIQKSGGGTGFSFSRLRPKNDRVKSTKGVSSGPVSFMKAFDAATETVKQGGTRRGANMAILRIDHPDILDFISCKRDQTQLNNFNISVGLTEEFMKAVDAGREYELVNPRSHEVVKKLDARKVFDTIVNLAWLNGEPGMVFLDRMNRDNPTPTVGEIEATNPCGEQPLLPFESCNLGSINLAKMVKTAKGEATVDYKLLGKTVKTAVRFLDNVIEQNCFPLKEIERQTKANRKIGLGVMGWSDFLIRLGIPYDSDRAVDLAKEVMGFIDDEGKKASQKLAKERGPFPNFAMSAQALKGEKPLRNATVTTIAPTGSISIIGNCSSGIEPLFAVCYIRRVLGGEELVEVHPYFLEISKERGFFSDELLQKIAEKGSLEGIEEIPADVRAVFKTTRDVTPEWHVKMQAAFQNHTDNAVSKTVNFPNSATREDIREVYQLAYKLGCKGVTVYRDGSRDLQVLNLKKKDTPKETKPADPEPFETNNQKGVRPKALMGWTHKIRTSEGKFYLTVNEVEGRPFEIFSTPNSRSREASVNAEALCRLVSLALRHGIEPKFIHDQLQKVRSMSLLSLPYNIAKVLEPYYESKAAVLPEAEPKNPSVGEVPCPECGTTVEHEGGCMVCRGCGYSKCA